MKKGLPSVERNTRFNLTSHRSYYKFYALINCFCSFSLSGFDIILFRAHLKKNIL